MSSMIMIRPIILGPVIVVLVKGVVSSWNKASVGTFADLGYCTAIMEIQGNNARTKCFSAGSRKKFMKV